jgi:hypothetical protein
MKAIVRQPNGLFTLYDHADDRIRQDLSAAEVGDVSVLRADAGIFDYGSLTVNDGETPWQALLRYMRRRGDDAGAEVAEHRGSRAVPHIHPPFQVTPQDTDEVRALRALLLKVRATAKLDGNHKIAGLCESAMWTYRLDR